MKRILLFITGITIVFGAAGCGSDDNGEGQVFSATLPAQGVGLQATSTRPPTITPIRATATTEPTLEPTLTAIPTDLPTTMPSPEPERVERFALVRPIRVSDSSTQRDYLDRTYPYGDSQGGTREVHSGVEFFNPIGTTVVAAGAGQVIYVGTDDTQLVGPRNGYYGNVIIIQHNEITSPQGEPVYTLYGHLDRILVVESGIVTPGMPIAEVGETGIAIGPHLHFEVRVGDDAFDFNSTRNPDLWIRPYPGAGIIAGKVVDSQGNLMPGVTVNVRSMQTNNELYAFTYGGEPANSDVAWDENFTRGDLPAGQYLVSVGQDGVVKFQQRVTVEERKITWLDIVID